jgi:hypothetical protein
MRNTHAGRSRYALARRLAALLLLGVVVGCGPGRGTVSGQVKFKGRPLPGGQIAFIPADPKQPPVFGSLDENGRYELTVAAGNVKISVDNRELAPPPETGKGLPEGLPPGIKLPKGGKAQVRPAPQQPQSDKLPGKYVEIPSKYYQIETSGLSYTVTAGSQTHDIELQRK